MIEDVLHLAPSDREVVSSAILVAFENFDAYAPDDVAIHPQLAADFCRTVNEDLPDELQLSQYACCKRLLRLRKEKRVHQTQDAASRVKLTVIKLSASEREAVEAAILDVYAEPAHAAHSPDEIAIHPQRAKEFCEAVNLRLRGVVELDQFSCSRRLLGLRKQRRMQQEKPR